ncbi:hypothetical protein RFI_33298 [Reticulomyxa filosa]|uniref:Kelch motif family protein n=1 Tax=Reticulomyxa filosa TaxID=46433 RepID=X6LR50_RETFI|nr:hypothetical protein RFI_33298 [Reticulomyxa filosa]|eukprot:ETO04104.1 hypothetical protein RFI_33298 [Reticulomyxa filosa]
MLLFSRNAGLSITYDETSNNFHFQNIRVCTSIRPLFSYACVCVNDCILFFGGDDNFEIRASKDVHKYSIKENRWMKFEQTLPFGLSSFVAILDETNTYVYIIGGFDGKKAISTHIRVKVEKWMKEETDIEKQQIAEEDKKIEIEKTKVVKLIEMLSALRHNHNTQNMRTGYK